jgi:hypothetical protein
LRRPRPLQLIVRQHFYLDRIYEPPVPLLMQTASLDSRMPTGQPYCNPHNGPTLPLSLAQYFDRSNPSALRAALPAKVRILKLTHSGHEAPQLGTLIRCFDLTKEA